MNRIFISSPIGLSVRLDGGAADISIITGAIADISTFDAAHFLFRKVVFLDLIHFKRFHGSRVLGFIQQIFIGFLSCDGVSGSAVLRILPQNPENYIIPYCLSRFSRTYECRTRFRFLAGRLFRIRMASPNRYEWIPIMGFHWFEVFRNG